jgi:zinc transport system ATP-binding protein
VVEPILYIHDLSFTRRGRSILNAVQLRVPAGSVLGIIGPNGGGKTTLLKLILGIEQPTRGQIRIAGLVPHKAVHSGRLVGYLPQSPQLSLNLPITTRDLVMTGLAGRTGLLRSHDPDDVLHVQALLGQVGLAELAETTVADLSGGELQRALIARALAPRPQLLLLDEPIVGIDRRGQQDFINLIQNLRTRLGLTVLLVSHDLRVVASVCDRVACVARTIHYHDVPQHIPADLMYRMFACDVAAFGFNSNSPLPRCEDPSCDGHHLAPPDPLSTQTIDDPSTSLVDPSHIKERP